MSRHSSPIDHRPFQTKAKLEKHQSLLARYGEVAIPEVAEALNHLKACKEDEQQQPAAVLASAA